MKTRNPKHPQGTPRNPKEPQGAPRNPKEPKIIQILKKYQCFSLDHRKKQQQEKHPLILILRSSARPASGRRAEIDQKTPDA